MDWSGCSKLYQTTLSTFPNEHAQSMFLFAQAWGNFLAHPTVLLDERRDNSAQFLWEIRPFMLTGPVSFYVVSSSTYVLLLIVLAGVFRCLRRGSAIEWSFWIAMLASIPLSAAIVMKSDGWRLLTVTHLFVAAFLALAFALPQIAGDKKHVSVARWQPTAIALGAAMLVFPIFPALAHAFALRELRAHPRIPAPGPHDEIVTGGRRMSGFLVLPERQWSILRDVVAVADLAERVGADVQDVARGIGLDKPDRREAPASGAGLRWFVLSEGYDRAHQDRAGPRGPAADSGDRGE
jgi:hypothetical protein